eukprot:TRINITY_DN898_c2_g1_i1.p1 TRINITY_DN898_c2_g1~~TRINITY_DN898_c2_g1_i1.p1  ORF type:complete len:775 (+),score=190.33 TRINITY_DN898_c2_g1_i1:1415-3739(+)
MLSKVKLDEFFDDYDTIVKKEINSNTLKCVGVNKAKTAQVVEIIQSELASKLRFTKIFLLSHPLHKKFFTKSHSSKIQASTKCNISLNQIKQCLNISGNREQIDNAIKAIEQLLDSELKVTTKEIREEDPIFVRYIESVFSKTSDKLKILVSIKKSTIECRGRRFVSVVHGDFFKCIQDKDAIVNPANSNLQHAGGLAKLICDRAGDAMVVESEQIIKRQSIVPESTVVTTSGGNLPVKRIIHAVGPIYKDGNNGEEAALKSCMINILLKMNEENLRHAVVPVISSGIYGFPAEKSTKILLETCVAWLESHTCNIEEIIFCENRAEVYKHLKNNARHLTTNKNGTNSAVTPLFDFSISQKEAIPIEYQWSWSNDVGGMTNYDDAENTQIETQFLTGSKDVIIVGDLNQVKNGKKYRVDFGVMTQFNTQTNYARKVVRTPKQQTNNTTTTTTTTTTSPSPSPTVPTTITSSDSNPPTRKLTYTITITGLEQWIDKDINELKTTYQKKILKKTIEFEDYNEKTVRSSLSKKHVLTEYGPKSITIQGLHRDMENAEAVIWKMKAEMKQSVYPDFWEDQEYNLKLVTLSSTSDEFTKIETEMKKTLANITILKIERIQNKILYEKYCENKKLMDKKNNLIVQPGFNNEKFLFHGTRSTAPVTIYNSTDGFDHKFSGEYCLWGIGSYFATRAAYSDSYASRLSSGEKQMFFAQVLVGDSKLLPQNNTLKMPPLKEKQSGTYENERYDSVTAQASSLDVNYVVYDVGRAYPTYLITYNNK